MQELISLTSSHSWICISLRKPIIC